MIAEKSYTLFKDVETFAKLERVIAVVCMGIPLLLFLAEQTWVFRESISNYVYMVKNRHVYGILLTMAAMLFLANGAIYLKESDNWLDLFSFSDEGEKKGRGYNILLGIFALGVAIFPHKEYGFLHFTCAILFFIGCSLVMFFYYEKISKSLSRAMALVPPIVLGAHFMFPDLISLLWAEWIALVVIGIHYIWGIKEKVEIEAHVFAEA